tara:strand:+ start:9123 stop:9314 length:192 start_codon:yes stop_codon:yes gene_type:complete
MIIGDNFIGLISHKFNENELNAYVIKLNMFPISICFEKHYDISHMEIKLILFQKYSFGIFINK